MEVVRVAVVQAVIVLEPCFVRFQPTVERRTLTLRAAYHRHIIVQHCKGVNQALVTLQKSGMQSEYITTRSTDLSRLIQNFVSSSLMLC